MSIQDFVSGRAFISADASEHDGAPLDPVVESHVSMRLTGNAFKNLSFYFSSTQVQRQVTEADLDDVFDRFKDQVRMELYRMDLLAEEKK